MKNGGEPHARCPSLRRVPRQPNLRAFRPFRRALLSARGGLFIPFLDPTPPMRGAQKTRKAFLVPNGQIKYQWTTLRGAEPTDEDNPP